MKNSFIYILIFNISIGCNLLAQDEVFVKVKKQLELSNEDTLVITPVKLKSSKTHILYTIYYVKKKPSLVRETSFFLVIEGEVYLQNEDNSLQNGEIYKNKILPYLKLKLKNKDLKYVDKKFVLHQYPPNF